MLFGQKAAGYAKSNTMGVRFFYRLVTVIHVCFPTGQIPQRNSNECNTENRSLILGTRAHNLGNNRIAVQK